MHPELLAQLASLSEQFAKVWEAFGLLLRYSPYWGPPLLAVTFWHVWFRYVRARFIADQEYALLELRLPAEVQKSPQAMLAVLDGLYLRSGENTFIDRIWLGKIRMWYSFEIVSMEGQVHLYVWARAAFRRFVERTFYAHYPEAEVVAVEDYALTFPFSLDTHNVYGMDYKLSGPIGVPIKTYTDYHLDQTSMKEEQKVNPMAHILEFAGSMGKGEYLWIQILARAHRKEDLTYGIRRNKKGYDDIAKEEVSKIRNSPEETIVFPDGGVGTDCQQDGTDTVVDGDLTGAFPALFAGVGLDFARHLESPFHGFRLDGTFATGMMPEVETVRCRAPIPTEPVMILRDFITSSAFNNGSP